ncbi:MAG: response regulator [Pseudomonadota bacterium]
MHESILIHAPTGRDAELAVGVLGTAGIACHACKSVKELILHLESGAGAVLIVEEALAGAMPLLAEFVDQQPSWSDIPILVLTRHGVDAPALAPALDRLGNVTLLERPVRTPTLVSALRSALRARQKQFLVREASRRKDEFLASLGHELRNPLAPIRNSMGILKHLYPDVPGVAKVRGVVERQVTHLTRLVDDLLDVARITNGKVVLQPETFTLASLVEHVLELAGCVAHDKMLTIDAQLPEQGVLLHADYARLIQVIANIVFNAVKFTPHQGNIRLSAKIDGGSITFAVKDSGIGIAPESFDTIFDLFSQEKPSVGPVTSGLGIGLNLSKRFTEMHGGSIRVESAGEGMGSEFFVTLPIVVGGRDNRSVQREQLHAATPSGGRPTVLVVDDNRDAANMLQALFEIEEFEVATAYDGFGAIAAVQQQIPNVIVMDLGMPGIDGYDTVRRIRAQPGAEHIKIVALTGWGQLEARRKAAEAGFDHHMVKPVDFDALKCLISAPATAD